MTGCSCSGLAAGASEITAERTVGQVARDPRALRALAALGIDVCCSAHLPLGEAAAAAGIAPPALVHAVRSAVRAAADDSEGCGHAHGAPPDMAGAGRADTPRPAGDAGAPTAGLTLDVRGLEPPQPMVRILERLETLAAGETLEVLHDRRPIFLYPQLDRRDFTHETDEPAPGLVRIRIRPGAAR